MVLIRTNRTNKSVVDAKITKALCFDTTTRLLHLLLNFPTLLRRRPYVRSWLHALGSLAADQVPASNHLASKRVVEVLMAAAGMDLVSCQTGHSRQVSCVRKQESRVLVRSPGWHVQVLRVPASCLQQGMVCARRLHRFGSRLGA